MEKVFSFNYGGTPFENLDPVVTREGENTVFSLPDGLTVTMVQRRWPAEKATHRVLWFENRGAENTKVLSDIFDGDFSVNTLPVPERMPGIMPREGYPGVFYMRGMVDGHDYQDDRIAAEEFENRVDRLETPDHRHYENLSGRSSDGTLPFFRLDQLGAGIVMAIGWTGSWQADFHRDGDTVHVTAGLKRARFYLKPGERVRTASLLVMEYGQGEDWSNRFRAVIRRHFSHKSNDPALPDGIFATELWGGLPSEEMCRRIGRMHRAGVAYEQLWIDAGWYGKCLDCDEPYKGDWARHTGDWTVNPRVHPDGLACVRDALHADGQHIMLWAEPERVGGLVAEQTPLYAENPHWFLVPPSQEGFPRVLDYGVPGVVDHIFEVLEGLIDRLDIAVYRQDFNTDIGRCFDWRADRDPDRAGMAEIGHICGMYDLWDRLLRRFPGLMIDNCAAGGRRIDIETLSRSIPFFRSDYQCAVNPTPEVTQCHHSGVSAFLPYTGCTTKLKNDDYAARSCYSSSYGTGCYSAKFMDMTDEELAWAAHNAAEYRAVRKYFSADFYNHGSVKFDLTAWCIWQYHDPGTDSGIVLAFRRGDSPFGEAQIDLKGLTGGTYDLVFYDRNGTATLAGDCMTLTIREKRSSLLVEYKKKSS